MFGWIRLRVDDLDTNTYPDRVTVVDWAFDDSGAPIPAGVPEPSCLGLLAAGAAGIAAMRRRSRSRKKDTEDFPGARESS